MRRLVKQAANAAVKTKGNIFEIVYRRPAPRLGHNQTIGAIAHRLCRLIWLILRKGVRYEECGPTVIQRSRQNCTPLPYSRSMVMIRIILDCVELPMVTPGGSAFGYFRCFIVFLFKCTAPTFSAKKWTEKPAFDK